MIFFQGYPRDTGASDMMDSSRLAGMMALINNPNTPDLRGYITKERLLVRCPVESPLSTNPDKATTPENFSRDQLMPLVAGLYAQGHLEDCEKIYRYHKDRNWFCINGDWLSPSHRMHLKNCMGAAKDVTLVERAWFVMDILWCAKIAPLAENNQLLAMLFIADIKYLKTYCTQNPKWKDAITAYWCTWREENDLADELIKAVNTSLLTDSIKKISIGGT